MPSGAGRTHTPREAAARRWRSTTAAGSRRAARARTHPVRRLIPTPSRVAGSAHNCASTASRAARGRHAVSRTRAWVVASSRVPSRSRARVWGISVCNTRATPSRVRPACGERRTANPTCRATPIPCLASGTPASASSERIWESRVRARSPVTATAADDNSCNAANNAVVSRGDPGTAAASSRSRNSRTWPASSATVVVMTPPYSNRCTVATREQQRHHRLRRTRRGARRGTEARPAECLHPRRPLAISPRVSSTSRPVAAAPIARRRHTREVSWRGQTPTSRAGLTTGHPAAAQSHAEAIP